MRIKKKSVQKKRFELNRVREEVIRNGFKPIKKFLNNKTVKNICKNNQYKYRRRIMPPMATLLHMIGAALSRDGSFQSSWHNNGQVGNSGMLSKARERLPEQIWVGLDRWIVGEIEREFGEDAKWRGHRVIGVDGTCMSMPDESGLAEEFGRTNSKFGESRFPILRGVIAFTLQTQIPISHEVGGYKTSEQALLRRMIKDMKDGDLIIADRHFAGANLYAEYKRHGLEFITRMHQRLAIDRLSVIKKYNDHDIIVQLEVQKKNRKQDPQLPEHIVVRLIKSTALIRGKKNEFWLMTSLIDNKRYPMEDIKELYKKRWKVETLIEEIKIWLSSDVLRSKTAPGIRKEIYARIVACQLIHWLMLKAAKKHKKDPGRISPLTATRLINYYSICMGTASKNKIGHLYEELLDKIAQAIIPDRPNRNEPRMKRRDLKHYPILHTTRAKWRAEQESLNA
jgi:hypothetical protein